MALLCQQLVQSVDGVENNSIFVSFVWDECRCGEFMDIRRRGCSIGMKVLWRNCRIFFCVVGEDGSFKVGENMKIYFGVFKLLNRGCWATSLCFSF